MKARYVVQCQKHGIESKNYVGRMVFVGRPETKKQRHAGCPLCKAEAMKDTT